MGVSIMMNDTTHIILSMIDVFDYDEYCSQTDKPVNRGIFYQTAGMIAGAKRISPDNPEEAYLQIINEMNLAFQQRETVFIPLKEETPQRPSRCGGCGGGQVR
jgi:hypothetical protein